MSKRDFCQTLWDACCNVGSRRWRKREEQLGIVSITAEENPCDVVAEPIDLVYSENRSGTNAEPWGMPVSRKQGLDKVPFHLTWKVRFVRYNVNHVRAESVMPSSVSVERRIWWLTVSNAENKSRRMRTAEWDEALVAPSDSVVSVQWAFLKPDFLLPTSQWQQKWPFKNRWEKTNLILLLLQLYGMH